jgi:uncharacterized spore protein YtfJ
MSMTTDDNAVLESLRDAIDHTVTGRVFGEPVVQDGLIVLPVAKVAGGAGGGGGSSGSAGEGQESGSGSGFGVWARPVGVFVIKDGKVGWRPAIDVTKVLLGSQAVAVAALLVVRAFVKRRRR